MVITITRDNDNKMNRDNTGLRTLKSEEPTKLSLLVDYKMNRDNTRLKAQEREEPTKKLSLLVDYSKKKAAIGNTKKSEMFSDMVRSRPQKSVVDAIGDALALSSNPMDESFNLEDVQEVSFRVRKSCIRRTKSMDERNVSSYHNLQNSIRSTLLMQAEGDDGDKEEEPSNDSESAPSSPVVDRRMQLANARRKNQSMRNLSTHSSAAALTTSPCASPAKMPRRTRAAPEDPLSKSNHGSCSNRRASLVTTSKCKSCRHMMRRTKSQNDSSLDESSLSLSLHGDSTLSPRQASLMSMKSHSLSRRNLLRQSMSRRNLLQASMSNLNGSSSDVSSMHDSSIFATGPRIIRHGQLK